MRSDSRPERYFMRAIRTGLCAAALLAMPLAISACAGTPSAPAAADWGQPRFAAWRETDPAYRFYPGDSFEVIVHSAPELSRTVEIGPDGRVALPLISDLMVAGRTDREIGDTIVVPKPPHHHSQSLRNWEKRLRGCERSTSAISR